MSQWLADQTLAHLRDVAEWPDLGPRYEIVERIGQGGMGVVFHARDRVLARDVAIKVFDRPLDAASTALLDEARVLGQLEHPGIVPVHDSGTASDGRSFYVMKLVRGRRLSDAQEASSSLGDRLERFLRVCDAVSFAHARGILHGDLKPENIMVGAFGEVLVMDWGVARAVGQSSAGDVVAGTPGFMAPEHARRGGAVVDVRADVYSLGALLDALLSRPVPRRLMAIIERARAARIDDRYPTVEALARDVTHFRDGEPVSAYRETVLERLSRFYQRYRLPILLVLTYMVMRVLLLLWQRS